MKANTIYNLYSSRKIRRWTKRKTGSYGHVCHVIRLVLLSSRDTVTWSTIESQILASFFRAIRFVHVQSFTDVEKRRESFIHPRRFPRFANVCLYLFKKKKKKHNAIKRNVYKAFTLWNKKREGKDTRKKIIVFGRYSISRYRRIIVGLNTYNETKKRQETKHVKGYLRIVSFR